MSSALEELKRRVEQLEREKEKAEARADQAEARADQAEARADQERREKEQAQSLARETTLEEYLQACHEYVLCNLVLITDGYLTSRAPTTNPTGKHCPDLLTPWVDFESTQIDIISKISHMLPKDERLFESIAFLRTIGNRIRGRWVEGEPSLVFVENNCIEDPVRIILSKLKHYQSQQVNLDIGDGVYFATSASSLRDPTDDVDMKEKSLRTDQVCVYRDASSRTEISYVIEYKAPHKLHTSHFEQGLRSMNIFDEVVNKPTIPTVEPAKFKHYAELLSAAAVTQTYHYMLEAGLEYGYVTNGDSIVFLKIDWTNPKELFYHLARPAREVEANEDPVYSNAVCQVLAFTALALQTRQHSNDERVAATTSSKTWAVDFNYIVDKIVQHEQETAKEAGPSTPPGRKHRRIPSSPDWVPTPIKKVKRKPQPRPDLGLGPVLRSRSRREGGGGPSAGSSSQAGSSQGGGSTSGSGSTAQASPGQGSSSTRSTRGSGNSAGDKGSDKSQQSRPYCTASCLLSLVNGWPLDTKCPNKLLHIRTMPDTPAGRQKHPVSYAKWIALLQQQLSRTLVEGVVTLGQEGACGALFQLTLLEYGYTFIAKGVTGGRVPTLQKEEAIYQRLQPLQGRHIPVCLGSVDLRLLHQVLYYDIDVRIIYFLLLSYGGTKLAVPEDPKTRKRIVDSVISILDQMHRLGVAHADIRLPNVLQSPAGEVTIVDFDQASILSKTSRRAMSALSPNKRRRLLEDDALGSSTASDGSREAALHRAKMREDKSNAQTLFTLDMGRKIAWPWMKEK